MSEELITREWAEPEVMALYRADVQKRADEHLAIYPNAKRLTEIREPEKSAYALFLCNTTDLSQKNVAERAGITAREVANLIFHRPEMWEKRRPRLAMQLAATTEELIDLMGTKLQDLRDNPEKLDKEGLKDISLSIGIVGDKAATFNGMATTVVEHRSGPTLDEAVSFREEIRQRLANKAKETAIDV